MKLKCPGTRARRSELCPGVERTTSGGGVEVRPSPRFARPSQREGEERRRFALSFEVVPF